MGSCILIDYPTTWLPYYSVFIWKSSGIPLQPRCNHLRTSSHQFVVVMWILLNISSNREGVYRVFETLANPFLWESFVSFQRDSSLKEWCCMWHMVRCGHQKWRISCGGRCSTTCGARCISSARPSRSWNMRARRLLTGSLRTCPTCCTMCSDARK